MDMYRALVLLHIGFGVVALATFWTAAWLRKGSSLHRRVGTSYLLAMLGVLGTALPMSAVFLWRGQTAIGVFLAYLVVITATACWLARRAVRLKRDRPAYYDARFRAVAWINLVAGVGVFALGIAIGHALLYLFCWVGVAIGVGMLRDLRLTTAPPNWWLREHYGSMLGNGVATHVAFLGIGMRGVIESIGWPWLELVPWIAPLGVAMAVGTYLDRRYGAARRTVAAS